MRNIIFGIEDMKMFLSGLFYCFVKCFGFDISIVEIFGKGDMI